MTVKMSGRFGALSCSVAICAAIAAPSKTAAQITPAALAQTVKHITRPEFEGRAPGTSGERKTIAYLVDQLSKAGLKPGGPDGEWTQRAPMVHETVGEPVRLELSLGATRIALSPARDIALKTYRETDHIAVSDAQLVFVGYGVHAPELGWDDFKGVDLHGKVAVFLVNDPDFEAVAGEDAYGKFGGRAMTYYGRWTYKYEEAARQGAAAALIIHEPAAAGYGWNVASNVAGGTYFLPAEPSDPQPAAVDAWISNELGRRLFATAGLDFDALKKQARSASFRPVVLGDERLSIEATVQSERIESHNVLARLDGKQRPDETIIFGAHWDAFGVGKPDAEGRTIRPGANDDGLGVAGVLAIARSFAKHSAPARSLIFAFWTGEERGLLGSQYYAAHPLAPLEKTAASITIDILQTAGRAHDVVLVGAGQNSLDQDLARAAASQRRTVTPDAKPERGLVYRADHFPFAKRGVPTLLMMGAGGGVDLIKGGKAAGDAWVEDYTSHCYHQPCDAWSPSWDLSGAAEDVSLLFQVGWKLANSRTWPSWNQGSEFAGVRELTAALRK
jgi:Zn-dependent M28 family amino/carboxypeptidase